MNVSELASVIRQSVAKAVAPLQAEIIFLKGQLASLPMPRDGKDADPDFMRLEIAKAVAALPAAAPGKDADPELMRRELAAAVAALPKAIDGKDADPEFVRQEVARAVSALPPAAPGKDADPDVIRREVASAVTAAVAAIPAAKDGENGAPGKDGESVRIADVEPIVRGMVATAVAEIPKAVHGTNGKDGVSVDEARVMDMIAARVKDAVGAIAVPRDGKDGISVDPAWVMDLVAKSIEALPKPKDGEDGKGVDFGQVMLAINELMHDSIQSLPKPKDGENGKDGKDGTSVDPGDVVQLIGKALDALPRPTNGRDGADADMVHLVEVSRAAAVAEVAKMPVPVDGKHGTSVTLDDVLPKLIEAVHPVIEDGIAKQVALIPKAQDGKDVDPLYVLTLVSTEVQRAVSAIPTPRDGENGKPGNDGKPGLDGFSIDDFEIAIEEDGRTLAVALRSGNREEVKKVKLAVPLYQGVHRPGIAYQKGDCVTHGGSLWIAQKDTTESPGKGTGEWTLSVKHGKDGRDAS